MHTYGITKRWFLQIQNAKKKLYLYWETCHNTLHTSRHNGPMTLVLLHFFLYKCIYNPHYGRPVADLNHKLGTLLIIIWYVTMWDDTTPTLWCSHKVNVKLHSAAALQQWAFKLIWLAVKPHAGARAHRDTHEHMRAWTQKHTYTLD